MDNYRRFNSGIGVIEEWPVTINVARLESLPETMVLNLPNQSPETLSRIRSQLRGTDGFLWTGGGEGCSALLSAIPGAFRATISCLSGTYGVETTPSGPRLARYSYDPPPMGSEYDVAAPPSAGSSNSPASQLNLPDTTQQLIDQEIDVMILYTANVRQALQADSINVQQYMQDTVDATQLAMDRSTTPGQPVIAELNLVHAQEISRAEAGYFYSDDMTYLINDPFPIALRNAWAADIVMYIRETSPQPNLCGLASSPQYLGSPPPGPAFAPFAMGVTKRECSFSGYPFQHEFGHIFGANHEPQVNTNTTPLQPWAFAHWANANNPEDSARTLVSTKHQDCHFECPQVLNYSNAAITLTKPWTFHTGLANQRENARIIGQYAPATAQYRVGLDIIFANGFE